MTAALRLVCIVIASTIVVPIGTHVTAPLHAADPGIRVVKLSGDYASLAMHPRTGDFAAVDPHKNVVAFYRQQDIQEDSLTPVNTVSVGPTPYAVCFKQFGDQCVFAVVCTQDANMYVIDAEKLTLLERVPLASVGVSSVFLSQNTEDPFIYYCYGSGHSSAVSAVDLRGNRHVKSVFDKTHGRDAMDAAVSADGLYAYRRGPYSPSGLEALRRTNALDDQNPSFAQIFYDHQSASAFTPGPFSRVVASGSNIYSATLETKIGKLPFEAAAFSSKRPLIFGGSSYASYTRSSRSGSSNTEPQSHRAWLQVASYNTMKPVGRQVSFQLKTSFSTNEIPRGVQSGADFKKINFQRQVLCDDAREQTIFAYRDHAVFVSWAEFELPDEPFLLPTFEAPQEVVAGEPSELKISADPRVTLSLIEQPSGIEISEESRPHQIRATWTPKLDAISETKFRVKAVFGDSQATYDFSRDVSYPSLKLPFQADRFTLIDAPESQQNSEDTEDNRDVDTLPNQRLAVISTIKRSNSDASRDGTSFSKNEPRIAVVDVANGKVLANQSLSNYARFLEVSPTHVFLVTESNPNRLDIHDLQTLELKHSIHRNNPIKKVEVYDGSFMVSDLVTARIYRMDHFQLEREISAQMADRENFYNAYGILLDGLLMDRQFQPLLLLDVRAIPSLLPAANNRWVIDTFGEHSRQRNANTSSINLSSPWTHVLRPGHRAPMGSADIPGTDLKVELALTSRPTSVGSTIRSQEVLTSMSLYVTGPEDQQIVLSRKLQPAGFRWTAGEQPPRPMLKTAEKTAYVIDGDRLYRWTATDSPKHEGDSSKSSMPIRWKYRQSAFRLADGPNTTLTHELIGAKPKDVKIELIETQEGMEIDSKTGTVVLDNNVILARAQEVIEQTAQSKFSPVLPKTIQSSYENLQKLGTQITKNIG